MPWHRPKDRNWWEFGLAMLLGVLGVAGLIVLVARPG